MHTQLVSKLGTSPTILRHIPADPYHLPHGPNPRRSRAHARTMSGTAFRRRPIFAFPPYVGPPRLLTSHVPLPEHTPRLDNRVRPHLIPSGLRPPRPPTQSCPHAPEPQEKTRQAQFPSPPIPSWGGAAFLTHHPVTRQRPVQGSPPPHRRGGEGTPSSSPDQPLPPRATRSPARYLRRLLLPPSQPPYSLTHKQTTSTKPTSMPEGGARVLSEPIGVGHLESGHALSTNRPFRNRTLALSD